MARIQEHATQSTNRKEVVLAVTSSNMSFHQHTISATCKSKKLPGTLQTIAKTMCLITAKMYLLNCFKQPFQGQKIKPKHSIQPEK